MRVCRRSVYSRTPVPYCAPPAFFKASRMWLSSISGNSLVWISKAKFCRTKILKRTSRKNQAVLQRRHWIGLRSRIFKRLENVSIFDEWKKEISPTLEFIVKYNVKWKKSNRLPLNKSLEKIFMFGKLKSSNSFIAENIIFIWQN